MATMSDDDNERNGYGGGVEAGGKGNVEKTV
jgi:hypothetical protein